MKRLTDNSAGRKTQGEEPRSQGTAAILEPPVFRLQILRSLRLHARLAALTAGIVLTLMLAAHFLMRPVYTAQSLVYVQPSPPGVMDAGPRGSWPYDALSYDSYIQQQVRAVSRPDILEAAVKMAGPGVWQRGGESLQSAADRLAKLIQVQREGNSYQVAISLSGSDKESIARTVNAVTQAYLAGAHKDEIAGSDARATMLREERDRVQSALGTDMAEQAALSKQLGVANAASGTSDPYTEQLNTLRAELLKARADHDQAAAQLTALDGAGRKSPAMAAAADEVVASDAGLSAMKTSMSQRRSQLIAQMATLAPANPVYQQDQTELKQLDHALAGMTADLQDKAEQRLDSKLRSDLARTAGVEVRINQQLAAMTAAATTGTPKIQRANELTSDIARLQQRFAEIDNRLHNEELQSNAPGSVHLSSVAQVPIRADAGLRHKLLLLALPMALCFGLSAAILAGQFDRQLHTPGDVEHLLGFAPMGVLPEPSSVPAAVEQEYLLRLAAGIDHATATSSVRTYLLTGVGNAETGRLARELGTMLARMGRRTLTIDAGTVLAPPETSEGVADDEQNKEGSVVEQNLRRLSAANDVVLISAPPVLLSSGTEYLARFADATLLVLESGKTEKAELGRAARLLERIQAPGVGAVLTSISARSAEPEFRTDLAAIEVRLQARHEGDQLRLHEAKASEWPSLKKPQPADEHETTGPSAPAAETPRRAQETGPRALASTSSEMLIENPVEEKRPDAEAAIFAAAVSETPVPEAPASIPRVEPSRQTVPEPGRVFRPSPIGTQADPGVSNRGGSLAANSVPAKPIAAEKNMPLPAQALPQNDRKASSGSVRRDEVERAPAIARPLPKVDLRKGWPLFRKEPKSIPEPAVDQAASSLAEGSLNPEPEVLARERTQSAGDRNRSRKKSYIEYVVGPSDPSIEPDDVVILPPKMPGQYGRPRR